MKRVEIIGGGLAGLTLGISLRREGVPVTIAEAASYPRHRVCGEFISGRGLKVLRDLGLLELLSQRGLTAQTTAFFHKHRRLGTRRLPGPALCISRYELDAALAHHFENVGGVLRTHTRVPNNLSGIDQQMPPAANPAEGIVVASGRRAEAVDHQGCRWIGLKIHARGVELEADLEMHFDDDAYVGLCRLPDGVVNVCGLFRRRHQQPPPNLRGRSGATLAQRLATASFDDDSACAVAALCLRPQRINTRACRIGDAFTMIPPITGNGMSMAFESAAVAAPHLHQYAQGVHNWPKTTEAIATQIAKTFGKRLRWAAWLHRVLFDFRLASCVMTGLYRGGFHAGYRLTRL